MPGPGGPASKGGQCCAAERSLGLRCAGWQSPRSLLLSAFSDCAETRQHRGRERCMVGWRTFKAEVNSAAASTLRNELAFFRSVAMRTSTAIRAPSVRRHVVPIEVKLPCMTSMFSWRGATSSSSPVHLAPRHGAGRGRARPRTPPSALFLHAEKMPAWTCRAGRASGA